MKAVMNFIMNVFSLLYQGDRVILGGDHYFRFNHPIEVAKNKKDKGQTTQEVKDFDYAKAELLRIQEAK